MTTKTSIIIFENQKEKTKQVTFRDLVIERYEEDTFKEILVKSKNLKESFSKFLKSANVTLNSTMDLMSYSFLIPIVVDVQSLLVDGGDLQTIAMRIAKRLIASGVVIVGQIELTETIKKILKKFE